MNRVFIFDVDGTLTPSRQFMNYDSEQFFDEWSQKNYFVLVSGSDVDKLKEQLPERFFSRALGTFGCAGNKLYVEDNLVYENTFKVEQKLQNFLEMKLKESKYPHSYGNHIEDRGSMVNFSIVGRNCTQEQREEYYKWDKENGERKIIAQAIKEKFPDLDAVIGGQISIDIYPKGNDKSQVLNVIEQERLVPPSEYIFIGDGIENGGNDYPLAKLMDNIEGCDWYHTKGWEHTKEILESLID